MLKSKKVIDQRFVNLFKVHKAQQNHVKLGFDGFDDEYIYSKPELDFEQSGKKVSIYPQMDNSEHKN